jgi:hypothetical protein
VSLRARTNRTRNREEESEDKGGKLREGEKEKGEILSHFLAVSKLHFFKVTSIKVIPSFK